MLSCRHLAALVLAQGAFVNVQAQVALDTFTDDQGPFVADPNNIVTDEPETVLFNAQGVLGEVRILLGNMNDDAPLQSTTTAEVSGGQWLCDIDFSPDGNVGDGACSVSYDRGCEERFYDFTGVDRFQFDIAALDGPLFFTLFVSDRNGNGGFGFLDNLMTGVNEIPRALVLPVSPNPVDWSRVSTITLISSNNPDFPGFDVSVAVNEISAAGTVQLVEGNELQCAPDNEDLVYEDGFES